MTEEDVIKRRLIFDGDGTGEDRRLNVMMKMIAKWIHTTDESEEDCQVMCDKILAQLALVEHSRHRSEFVHKQTEEQTAKYKALQTEMETNISIKKDEIAKQKDELEKAKIIKQNRIQYDLLAKAIAKEPPRTDMNKNLKILQRELAELASEKKQLENKLDSRRKQFNVLSTSANCLSELLLNDTKENAMGNKSSKDITTALQPEPMSE